MDSGEYDEEQNTDEVKDGVPLEIIPTFSPEDFGEFGAVVPAAVGGMILTLAIILKRKMASE